MCFGGAAAGWGSTRIEHESARLLAMRDYKAFAEVLGLLAAMLHAARRAAPQMKSLRVEEPAESKQAEPQLVRVVSLPPRRTTSEVARDEAGAISTVQQIERDL
jgi:hypothetical protein